MEVDDDSTIQKIPSHIGYADDQYIEVPQLPFIPISYQPTATRCGAPAR
jgi:hypothetical protein